MKYSRMLAMYLIAMASIANATELPQDVTVMVDLSTDNGAISAVNVSKKAEAVADLIAGLHLKYGDTITLIGLGSKGWDQTYGLAYRGLQPKAAPQLIADQISSLGDEGRAAADGTDVVWAIERLKTSCDTRKTTVVVVSDMIRSGSTDGTTSFTLEGVPGVPHKGCDKIVFLGVGEGSHYPKAVTRAAEAVITDLGEMMGFNHVDIQH